MDRKTFFKGVREFKSFTHPKVSNLSVDEEFISFAYTDSSKVVNVSFDLHASPRETHVYIGEKLLTYQKKSINEIMNSILSGLYFT